MCRRCADVVIFPMPAMASSAEDAAESDAPATSALAAVIAELRADAAASPYLDPSRTPEQHVDAAVTAGRVAPALATAREASARLATAVRDEVVLRKEALLAEVDAVSALEKEVATVDAGVRSLSAASDALAEALAAPYDPMRGAVLALENVHSAAALVQAVERFWVCTKRLADAGLFPTFSSGQKTAPEVLPAAAEAVRELEELLSAGRSSDGVMSVGKVDVVAKFVPAVRKASVELRRRTAAMLKSGLAARDQAAVTSAVLSYHALGVMSDRINAEVGRLLAETQTAIQRGLEAPRAAAVRQTGLSFLKGGGARTGSHPLDGAASRRDARLGPEGSVAMPNRPTGTSKVPGKTVGDGEDGDGGGAGGRDGVGGASGGNFGGANAGASSGSTSGGNGDLSWEVWSRVETMLEAVRDACLKAILLQQVLSKRYDEVTHFCLLYEPIATGFIDAVAKALGEQIAVIARTHRQRATTGQVFRTLASDYPRLRSLLLSLSMRVHAIARAVPYPITSTDLSRSQLPLIPDKAFVERSFVTAASDVETYYLSASLERLTSAVSSMFEQGRPAPGEAEALAFARLLAAELGNARAESDFFATSISNVSTALRIYSSNAQDFAKTHSPQSDTALTSPVIMRDWPLARLYNGLITLCKASKRALGADENGSGPLPASIQREVNEMTGFADQLLAQPFAKCSARILRAIEHIHTEDLTCHSGSDDGCSIYAVDLTAQLSLFADGVVLLLARSRSLGQATLNLAHRVLDLFVLHANLAFPLPVVARQRLSTDMARVELAVEGLCPVRMLGKSYLAIRALRRLVFMTEEELLSVDPSSDVLDVLADLSPSTVAHHLFARSKDANFLHPHRRQDIAPPEYATWLNDHSEEEAWAAVEKAVKSYEAEAGATPCPECVALKALSPLLRERWATQSAVADDW